MVQKKQGKLAGSSAARLDMGSLNAIPQNIIAAVEHTVPESQDEETLEGRSLGIFGPSNPLRKWLAFIIWHPRFEQAIIVLIFFSSITLALDSPRLDPHGGMNAFLVRAQAKALVHLIPSICCMLYI